MEPVRAFNWSSCPADILYLVFNLLSSAEYQVLCLSPLPITQLLRTLLSKPQLAAHVRSLHLDGFPWAVHGTRFKLPQIHIPENQLDEAIARELCDCSVDALVALLLAQLSSLQYLYLGHAFTQQSICEPDTYKLGNFQYLEQLSFLHHESRDKACSRKVKNTAAILPFFYLPNLQQWYYDSGVDNDFVTQTMDLDQIAAVLPNVQGTLTDLIITADCQPGVNNQFFPGLEVIKTLQIPLAFLVGFAQDETKQLQGVIPRNIVFLTITDDLALQNCDYLEEEWPLWELEDYAILGLLESWLREWIQWTPHLSRITLLLSWIDTETNQWSPRAREQLGDLSSQVDIPVEVINAKQR
ncbi:hypothetical protein BDW60DRAFT_224225 [Aspergillus nidulans var. acristatus]